MGAGAGGVPGRAGEPPAGAGAALPGGVPGCGGGALPADCGLDAYRPVLGSLNLGTFSVSVSLDCLDDSDNTLEFLSPDNLTKS